MALTPLQRRVCRVLSDRRLAAGERYVAGGAALNTSLGGARVSRDLDPFHDTEEALQRSAEADRAALLGASLQVEPVRELRAFVEVLVRDEARDEVVVEWVRDSAFRFFPLVLHPELGLTLHPYDLATNKVLALVGRVEVRDWVDTLTCHERLSPLGCLAWAAAGKDIGLTPLFILDEAARTARYAPHELDALVFEGAPPDPAHLARTWRSALAEARAMTDLLPAEQAGRAVLTAEGAPFHGTAEALDEALQGGSLLLHPGSIGGVMPTVRARRGPTSSP